MFFFFYTAMKTALSFALCLLVVLGLEAQATKTALSRVSRQSECNADLFNSTFSDCIDAVVVTMNFNTSVCSAICQPLYDLYCECLGENATTQVFALCGGFRGNTTNCTTDPYSTSGSVAGIAVTYISLLVILVTLASIFSISKP